MADKKISALTGATTPLAGTEVLPIVQGSATVKVSVANLTAGRAVAMAGGSFTDNITQSTAAKGVNFTANTPAAGMTSQLMNWYEEGTWTPNQGAAVTVVGAFASSGTYIRIGRFVMVRGQMSGATSIALASSNVFTSNLPFTVVDNSPGLFSIGVNGGGTIVALGASTQIYSSSTVAATASSIIFSATYFVA